MRKKLLRFIGIGIWAGILTAVACSPKAAKTLAEDKVKTKSTASVSYMGGAQSIINSNCGGCHSKFKTYEGLKPILDNGKFNEVVLVKKTMPKGRSLSMEDYDTLKKWVEGGMVE